MEYKFKRTYCNPLPMPDYPHGSEVNGFSNCRELADPTVIWHRNKWILYATIGSVYESEDYKNWKVCTQCDMPKLVAPTVVEHKNKFYLMGSESALYCADSPYGPFEELGKITDDTGEELYIRDPMLFSDDDEKLYLYWGLGKDGIYGMELDHKQPCRGIGKPISLCKFCPEHVWERMGAWNQNEGMSFIEGAWMLKHQGEYYLIYSASGTCYRTYAWGVYRSRSPLKDFIYQKTGPILLKKYGLVNGTGHGSVVKGPGHTYWAFYTVKMCYATKYERRIAMDPVGFDETGNLYIGEVTEIPQWLPGIKKNPEKGNDSGLLPLTSEEQAVTSSHAPGRDALYAVDESMLTWWEPSDKDSRPFITIDLRACYKIAAIRIIWRDVNLDYEKGILPGPFQYKVEGSKEGTRFEEILDCTDNQMDYAVDYRTFPEKEARHIRLVITGCPEGIRPGVINFTAFGTYADIQE
ncbi:MAG: family 43 glycosylhydrolase [Eubacteriales bacterium]|nr:family 43 glycosylhydrolase [Eubacteriales bacterium]